MTYKDELLSRIQRHQSWIVDDFLGHNQDVLHVIYTENYPERAVGDEWDMKSHYLEREIEYSIEIMKSKYSQFLDDNL